MRPAKFDYQAPDSLEEAVKLLAETDGMGRVLAGGQSLMPAMNLRLARPTVLIDINGVGGLKGITVKGDSVSIGPLTKHQQIIESPELAELFPVMREAGSWIAHSTIRLNGTIGGSLALADPAAEWATTLTLLGGRLKASSIRGDRWIPVEEFFSSYYTTALAEDEILSDIEIPVPKAKTSYGFEEFSRQRGAFALAMTAVALRMDGGGSIAHAKAVIGGCGPCPILVDLAGLIQREPDDALLDSLFSGIGLEATSDIHATAQDRVDIARELFRRCISRTYETAGGF